MTFDSAHHVNEAVRAWDAAPLHVRSMAGHWVNPIIWSLVAIVRELEVLRRGTPGTDEKETP